MHYGNIGAFLGGISAVIVAVAALIRSPAALRAWIERQQADRDLATEQAKTIQLERRRYLDGWSQHGINSFEVAAVTDQGDIAEAGDDLLRGIRGPWVLLRIAEGDNDHNANRAGDLVRLVEREGCLARPPSAGELEALDAGLEAMGIPRAPHG